MAEQPVNDPRTLVVHALSTEGFVIVTDATYHSIVSDERLWDLPDQPTWAMVKELGLSFRFVSDLTFEDLEEVVDSVESDLGLDAAGTIERRWAAIQSVPWVGLEFEYNDEDEFPTEGGLATALDIRLQWAMLQELPAEVIERFDIAYTSVNDGDLARIEELDPVITELEALGYRFSD